MSHYSIGNYLIYITSNYIVIEENETTVKIRNPLDTTSAGCVVVCKSNTITTGYVKARLVSYENKKYLVTSKGIIISLTSEKVMKWDEKNGNRIAILKLIDNK